MDRTLLQDRISWGMNVAARTLGTTTDAHRPTCADAPVAPVTRYLRLHAAFAAIDGKFTRPVGYGGALWQGIFDSAYTRPGDYLAQRGDIWFVAAQQPLLPVLCVQTNRRISISRPAAPGAAGVNPYGGISLADATRLISDWPASVLGATTAGRPDANLPSDSAVAHWNVLLPIMSFTDAATILFQPSDLLVDDLGRTAIIAAAELSALGWRLTAKQATT